MNRDQIEVGQAAAQFLRAGRGLARARLVEAKGHLLAEEEQKRRHALRNGDEVVSIETLKTASFLGTRGSGTRSFSERISHTENIATRDETSFVGFARDELDHFDDAAIDTVDLLGHIAGGVDQLVLAQVADMGQLAERLQLNRPKSRAKGEEVATGHVAAYSRSRAERCVNFCVTDFYVVKGLAMSVARVKSEGACLSV